MKNRPYRPDVIRIVEMEDWYEADPNEVCHHCGCRYREHQPVSGYSQFVKLCNGDLVKLF